MKIVAMHCSDDNIGDRLIAENVEEKDATELVDLYNKNSSEYDPWVYTVKKDDFILKSGVKMSANDQNANQELIDKYTQLVNSFDLTYEYSDDHNVWRRGNAHHSQILAIQAKLPKDVYEPIWNAMVDKRIVAGSRSTWYIGGKKEVESDNSKDKG